MGIIIIPVWFLTLVVGIISILKMIKLVRNKRIGIKEFALGSALFLFLLGIVSFSYVLEQKVWALSPTFRLPFFMVFIPFFFYLIFANNTNTKYLSIVLIIEISISTIVGVLFTDLIFNLLDYLNVEKIY